MEKNGKKRQEMARNFNKKNSKKWQEMEGNGKKKQETTRKRKKQPDILNVDLFAR